MTFGPFGILGKAAGIKTPLDVGAGAALGGVAGHMLFDKKSGGGAPDPRNDPYYRPQGSTPAMRSGRGASSLSV